MKSQTHTTKPAQPASVVAAPGKQPFFQKKPALTNHPLPQRSLQQSLVTGHPGDAYERQADTVADIVTRRAPRPGGAPELPLHRRITPLIQRQPLAEEEPMQAQAVPAEEEPVQAQASPEEKEPLRSQTAERQEPVQAQAEKEDEPVQAQAAPEEKEPLQAQTAEPQEPLQAQAEKEEEPVQAQTAPQEKEPLQAQAEKDEEPIQSQAEKEEPVQAQASADEEEPLQAQTKQEDEPLQAQAEGAAEAASPSEVREQLRKQRGQGRTLPAGVRQQMELRFGADFSGVRIHTDDPAIQLTRLLRANAFTQGNEIFFNQGRFAPGSPAGEHLLAHELTHTIQQGAVGLQTVQPQAEPAPVQRQEEEEGTILVRPELLAAIKLARGEIGKVNAKQTNADQTRLGWERLAEYFFTAFGEQELIHQDVIKFIKKAKNNQGELKDTMPSWCGIFVWWAYKKSGIPIPNWKLGASIMKWVVARKPGELPRKGDIAYRDQPFQHFALVTGVESPKTAAGKKFESVLVATVNGNTSGDDNIGGQIEEKWEPISRWSGFFDPVGKLDMPPAPLVKTSVEPEPATTSEAEAAAAPPPSAALAPTDVSHLEQEITSEPEIPTAGETDVPVALPQLPAPPEGEPVVELPSLPAPPTPEAAATVEPLPLEGPSDEAMGTFVAASPSQMAATQPGLGSALDGKIQEETQEEVENAPVLVAHTSGEVNEGLTPPDQIPLPAETPIGDGVTGAEPEALSADPHENFAPAPSNEANEKELDKHEEGGFLSWLRDNISGFLKQIRTSDPGLNTNAGERPNVQLEGEADPGRIDSQRDEAKGQIVGQRDATTNAFKNHPGQQNIQPRQINEQKEAAPTPKVSVTIETQPDAGVADYVAAPLSADVRQHADELLKPTLESNLNAAKQQTEQAATQRDTDKAAAINDAETKTVKINQDADAEQRGIVIKNRQAVATQQKDGIEAAYNQVNQFSADANSEQTAARKEIGEKVKDSEGKAGEELAKGEADAAKEKEKSEKEAADKKKEMEEDQEDESWWDRAVGAIKKAVKAITDAIDFIFTKLREAVKFIIEKAKNAAISLINTARNWVVDKLNKFRDWAKEQVNTYLKDSFPELAERINGAIDSVVDTAIEGVNLVADTAIAAVEAVAKVLASALDKVLAFYQGALKAAVQIAGAVLTGDFAEALRIAIRAACDLAGIDAQPIFDFIDRAAAQIVNILKHPMDFFNNVMAALGGGVTNFVKNIQQHLISGLIGWLTGALSEVAITLPATFDIKGIFSLVMQILGLTYENIKAKIIKKFPPAATVFNLVEKGFALVMRLVNEGPIALWEEAKASLANLQEIVLGGIRTYVITTVVKEAITWLLGLLNPAGALVKILKLAFDLVMFLVERFEQIKDFVVSVYNAISAIAAGSLGPAMAAVEGALARSLPVVISLLASLAGLGGIGKTVKGIITKVSAPVNKVVDAIVDKIVAFAMKLVGKGKAAAQKVKEKLLEWWKIRTPFQADDGQQHTLSYQGSGKSGKLVVQSTVTGIDLFLSNAETAIAQLTGPEKSAKQNSLTKAKATVATLKPLREQLEQEQKPEAKDALFQKLTKAHNDLARQITPLFGLTSGELPATILPPFADGVKAISINASFISTTKTPPGQTANAHSGQLRGWDQLQTTGLREKENWVKMHLLHHNLGGKATDSNLTPAKSSVNQRFYSNLEKPALDDIKGGKEAIWFKVDVRYHTAQPDFINSVTAQYGFHLHDKNWQKGPAKKQWSTAVEPPNFPSSGTEILALNESGKAIIGRFAPNGETLDDRFITILLAERNKSQASSGFLPYAGLDDMANRLNKRYPKESSLIVKNVTFLIKVRTQLTFNT